MDILTYDQIDDTQMSELTLACFNHAYSREHVARMVAADSRLPDWGGELYACENGKILGTVGLLYPRMKTSEGTIRVGGIRNVCTRPSASRRGTARKLMEEAHRRMIDEGIPLSFLMTSRSLIAYDLYLKLSYRDVHVFPVAFKKVEPVKPKVEFIEDINAGYIRDLYTESIEGLNGLNVREEGFLKMASARGWPDNDNLRMAYEDDKPIGYVMYRKRRKQLDCGEVAAESTEKLMDILLTLEATADREYIVFYYINPKYYGLLRQLGYTISTDNWGRVMMKELTGEHEFSVKNGIFHVGIYETY